MKIIQKYFYALAGVILLSGLLLLCSHFSKNSFQQIPPEKLLEFHLETESGTETITLFPGEDGIVYGFLPPYAQQSKLTIHLTSDMAVFLNGEPVTDGMDCSGLDWNSMHTLSSSRMDPTPLRLYASGNIPTLHINTLSGSMTSIHADKSYEESSTVSLYSADGTCLLSQSQATISGRGNSTWLHNKRPYNLFLSADTDLLGLGSASNWVLLANAYDETNLHNKLVMDFAHKAGLSWSPNSAFVALYLNGQYNGLYLLTEKVESHQNRLPLNTQTGDFLCKMEYEYRRPSMKNPFHTNRGRTIEITAPVAVDANTGAYIQEQVNALEKAIFSGEDLNNCTLFDMDSWVRKYLIDEIFMNFDADGASSFFYFHNGIFYAGPVWDYDMILGSMPHIRNPHSFYANLSSRPSIYYQALYNNDSFYQQVIRQYKQDFLPLLEELLATGIDRYFAELSSAIECNRLRWLPFSDTSSTDFANQTSSFLAQRIDFLNRAWLDNVAFCSIHLIPPPGSDPHNMAVEYGGHLDLSGLGMEDLAWRNTQTGEPFDSSQPITEDLVLEAEYEAQNLIRTASTQEILTVASIAAITLFLLLLTAADIRQRIRERRNTNANERTKVSS